MIALAASAPLGWYYVNGERFALYPAIASVVIAVLFGGQCILLGRRRKEGKQASTEVVGQTAADASLNGVEAGTPDPSAEQNN
jgi:hypothetical protein